MLWLKHGICVSQQVTMAGLLSIKIYMWWDYLGRDISSLKSSSWIFIHYWHRWEMFALYGRQALCYIYRYVYLGDILYSIIRKDQLYEFLCQRYILYNHYAFRLKARVIAHTQISLITKKLIGIFRSCICCILCHFVGNILPKCHLFFSYKDLRVWRLIQ